MCQAERRSLQTQQAIRSTLLRPVRPTTPETPLITMSMTVNHVLKIHPKAREAFDAFKVDCETDGCHCLDELYWRRGVDVEALLQALNQPVVHQTVSN